MRHRVDRYLDRLGGLLLPPRCVLCGGRGQPPCLDLCRRCEGALPVARPALASGPWPLRHSFAPCAYGEPVDHLVRELKYRGHLAVARVLGDLLAQGIGARDLQRGIDVIVPVPLHPARHAERSFNQSAEIARRVARALRCAVDATLAARRRETQPQVGLPADERRANLAGAFAARPGVCGLHVAVLDDVLTTGSTLQELAQALLEAGAASVVGWCVCRAPQPLQVESAQESEAGHA